MQAVANNMKMTYMVVILSDSLFEVIVPVRLLLLISL